MSVGTIVAIWTANGWAELERLKWPRGKATEYAITESTPTLGATVSDARVVLAVDAHEELANEFGEAFLVIIVPPRSTK